MNSLSSIELRTSLSQATGPRLPVTVVFGHPTIAELATGPGDGPACLPARSPASRPDAPVAVVGAGGFLGSALVPVLQSAGVH